MSRFDRSYRIPCEPDKKDRSTTQKPTGARTTGPPDTCTVSQTPERNPPQARSETDRHLSKPPPAPPMSQNKGRRPPTNPPLEAKLDSVEKAAPPQEKAASTNRPKPRRNPPHQIVNKDHRHAKPHSVQQLCLTAHKRAPNTTTHEPATEMRTIGKRPSAPESAMFTNLQKPTRKLPPAIVNAHHHHFSRV